MERYHIMPSQYLGLDKEEVNPEAERAFLLACALTSIEEEKKQAKKAKRKGRRK